MRKHLLFVLCALYLVFSIFEKQVSAGWDCNNIGTVAIPDMRCEESATATTYKTLRECLTHFTADNVADDLCKDDPRYVMRNFAALNFWSIGRGLSLAVPLAITGGAVLCLVFMLYGAYTYITSGGEEKKITESTHTMTYAGLGLILIIVAYALVRTVLYVTKVNTFGF